MVAARRCQGLNWRLGLSRNKVAVPEGAAGTPPFWRPVPDSQILKEWFVITSFKSISVRCEI